MKRDVYTILIGSLFIAAGVAVGGTMLGFFDLNLSLRGWWTVFIIVPALISIVQGGLNAGNAIMLGVGVLLFMSAQGILPAGFGWKLILPFVLLVVGFQLLTGGALCGGNRGCGTRHGGARRDGKANDGAKPSDYDDDPAKGESSFAQAMFGEQTVHPDRENYRGGSYAALFGSVIVDLRDAIISEDVVVTVSALFGGITVFLPEGVRVITHVTPIFGGVDDKRAGSGRTGENTVIIRGSATFGGIELK